MIANILYGWYHGPCCSWQSRVINILLLEHRMATVTSCENSRTRTSVRAWSIECFWIRWTSMICTQFLGTKFGNTTKTRAMMTLPLYCAKTDNRIIVFSWYICMITTKIRRSFLIFVNPRKYWICKIHISCKSAKVRWFLRQLCKMFCRGIPLISNYNLTPYICKWTPAFVNIEYSKCLVIWIYSPINDCCLEIVWRSK